MHYDISPSGILSGERVIYVPSPNFGDSFEAECPDTILLHYTAMDTAHAAVTRLTDASLEISAHFVLGRAQDITQLVSCNRIAWHAGLSSWQGRERMNRYSIGIEIDNAGLLEKKEGYFYSYFGGRYAEAEVESRLVEGQITYWHKFKTEQVSQVIALCQAIMRRYAIKQILGHSDVSPGRKMDPGPVFPIERVREQVLVTSLPHSQNC